MQTCPGFFKKSLLEYPANLLEICSVKSVDTLNRHSCSTPAEAETQDRKCFSMQLVLVVGKVDMINQICQMLSFC